jgi:hypothetical protein
MSTTAPPPPPREQLCNRYCSNKHTQFQWTEKDSEESHKEINCNLKWFRELYEDYDRDVGWDKECLRTCRQKIRQQVNYLCEKLEELAEKLLATEKELLAKEEQGIAQEPVSPQQGSLNPPCFWHHSDLAQAAGLDNTLL